MTTLAATRHLALDPDRLLPVEPRTREIARRLYGAVAQLPIVSPHGHVPPRWLADDVPFSDPTSLLVAPDHYVFRLLHAQGVSLADLGVGGHPLTADESRRAWRLLAEHWPAFRGTPSRFWMDSVLADVFGVTERLAPASADAIYDRIAEAIAAPDFRPRALMERFGIDVLATTDDPVDDLHDHRILRDDLLTLLAYKSEGLGLVNGASPM